MVIKVKELCTNLNNTERRDIFEPLDLSRRGNDVVMTEDNANFDLNVTNAANHNQGLESNGSSSSGISSVQNSSPSSSREGNSSSGNDDESGKLSKRKRKPFDHVGASAAAEKRLKMNTTNEDQSDSSSSSEDETEADSRTGHDPNAGEKGAGAKKSRTSRKRKGKNARRNIKDVIGEELLEATTKDAKHEEAERLKRLNEQRKQRLEHLFLEQIQRRQNRDLQAEQLKFQQIQNSLEGKQQQQVLINLGSSDEGENNKEGTKSSDSDIKILSDDEVLAAEAEEEDEGEDPNNSGMHVDDSLNVPNPDGNVVVNFGHPDNERDIFLPPQLSRSVKRHQIGGIRFLYDNIIESGSQYNQSQGFGCILAHSMGLGKTIQIVSFCDVFLRNTPGKRVLCVVPINTIQNWVAEFEHWLPDSPEKTKLSESGEVRPRNFNIYVINDLLKNLDQRSKVIIDWKDTGGVLLMGYELYRQLANKKPRKRKKKVNGPECIDIEEEDRTKCILEELQKALVNPGPDLVVCDEGHRIKNSHASISQALKAIKTRRRIVLTGYPLQNNLMEYWCMVDFVRPNFLGTKTEFSNMFERPIQNGQCVDSTPKDVRLMMHRAHVLHNQLQGFVQRRGHQVLQCSLPPKTEHVFFLRMTNIQRTLYKKFMDELITNKSVSNPLKAFAVCCKIWNHPDVLYNFLKKKEAIVDLDLDLDDLAADKDGKVATPKKTGKNKKNTLTTPIREQPRAEQGLLLQQGPGFDPFSAITNNKREEISYDWANDLMADYIPGILENSTKFQVFFEILEETIKAGDRLLLFSQSLLTLNLLEQFLQERNLPGTNRPWLAGSSYFRLDGSTPGMERERLINAFNSAPNGVGPGAVPLFIVSTRAGSLGVNLVGANRVVVFDASWNPCHDAQAVCRVYRYGQAKHTFIYRLVSDNSIEKKIYDRQINKIGMADRVVDEMNPDNHLSSKDINNLICENEEDPPAADMSDIRYPDGVLQKVIENCQPCFTKAPFAHESLLIDRKDKKLTKAEKRLAERSYQLEKGSKISYTRPSYAAFYPQQGMAATNLNNPGSNGYTRNRYFDSSNLSTSYRPYGDSGNLGGPSSRISTNTHLGGLNNSLLHSSFNQFLEGSKQMAISPQRSSSQEPTVVQPQSQMPHTRPPQTNIPEGGINVRPGGSGNAATNGGASKKFPIESLQKQGVAMENLVVPKDMTIPTSAGLPPISLKKDQKVMVIKTPKGIYLRMGEKIIKIRLPSGLLSNNLGLDDVVNVGSSDSSSENDTERLKSSPAKELFQMVANASASSSCNSPDTQQT